MKRIRKKRNGITRMEFSNILDDIGMPESVQNEKGWAKRRPILRYGKYLQRTDPIQFSVAYNEYIRENF